MAAEFQVEIDDRELMAALNRAIAVLSNPQPIYQDIADKLEANAQLRFETKTDPTGARWQPLKPATLAKKKGVGSLLIETNRLRASLATNVGPDYIEIGTSRATDGGQWQIGFLHETGTRRMPRRGILLANADTGTLGAEDEADMLAILNAAIGEAFG